MSVGEATALIGGRHLTGHVWTDLGCGNGTITLALASLLPRGSVVHAMDRDASALRGIPSVHNGTKIVTHRADFTALPWPFDRVHGVLMANSLHYVRDQAAFLRACQPALAERRFLIVEYDTDQANTWVPYPVSRARLSRLFADLGYGMTLLGTRPSIYRRAQLYAVLVQAAAVSPEP